MCYWSRIVIEHYSKDLHSSSSLLLLLTPPLHSSSFSLLLLFTPPPLLSSSSSSFLFLLFSPPLLSSSSSQTVAEHNQVKANKFTARSSNTCIDVHNVTLMYDVYQVHLKLFMRMKKFCRLQKKNNVKINFITLFISYQYCKGFGVR